MRIRRVGEGVGGARARRTPAREVRSPIAKRPSRGPTRPFILVVDDDDDQRELYRRYLAWRGLRVETASDGHQALNIVRLSVPDLIVMDLSLPHLDGWEATRQLKRDRLSWHIPILACTGHVLSASLERALDAGCDAWVVKPCLPQDLFAEIRRVLFGRPLSRGATRRQRPA